MVAYGRVQAIEVMNDVALGGLDHRKQTVSTAPSGLHPFDTSLVLLLLGSTKTS
jgi:hypothetical protein